MFDKFPVMIEQPPHLDIKDLNLDLIFDSDVYNLIQKINENYYYWDKVKYLKPEGNKNVESKEIWAIARFLRNGSSKQLTIPQVSTHFSYFITDKMQKLLHEFDMNIGGFMGSSGIIPENDKNKYLVSSIIEEAISSSQMEGASTTRRIAKDMILKETRPRDRSQWMILNNYETIRYIIDHKTDELTPGTLLFLHKSISRNTLDDPQYEGKFRTSDDIFIVDHTTSESVYSPPPAGELDVWINFLCDYFNKESESFVHPIVRGIIIHFLLAYIHPFVDGNGRTARAIFYWYLLKQGYWLMEYISISSIIYKSKSQYEKSFLYTESDNNDLSYFIDYNLEVMQKAFDSLRDYIDRKIKEQKKSARFLKLGSFNERQAEILKMFSDEPQLIITVKEMQNRFHIANQTARSDINGLVARNLLEPIHVNNKKVTYIRSDNFESSIKKMEKKIKGN